MAKLGKLDENSLQQVIKEFNRCKKGTAYRYFRITDYIDSGRFARVYAVERSWGGRLGERLTETFGGRSAGPQYALRIAENDRSEKDAQKNLRELSAVNQLMRDGQKHIVPYLMHFAVETEFGIKYCTLMPYLSTLSRYNNAADDVELAVRCGNDLLPLLQICMQRHILHRDIKPQNIFFDRDFRNESGLILGDFGEARWDSDGTVSGIGTPATVSPEIACFDDDIKNEHSLCDMYSLGIVMYYYLNNRTYPFGNNEEAHRRRLSTKDTLPPPQYGSVRLKRLVLRATQYYPSKRFASPAEMLSELKKCEEYAAFIAPARPDHSSEETWRIDRPTMAQTVRSKMQNVQRTAGHQPQPPRRQDGQTSARSASGRLTVQVGSRLTFGSYPQTAAGESQPIVWRVLDVRDGRALIITENLIDYKRFNEKLTEVTWEECSLRQWLNGEFMTKAFGSTRLARVVPVTNRNGSVPPTGYAPFNPTRDQVFALSAEEAERYFGSKEDMVAHTTDYAHRKKFDYDDRSDDWWLRSSCADKRHAVCVDHSGGVKKSGCDVNYYNVGVRPVLWLKL